MTNSDQCLGLLLLIATKNNQLNAVSSLLHAGAPVDYRNDLQETPLHVAARKGHHAICALLLQHGAFIDSLTEKNISPLRSAAAFGHDLVCRLLLEHKASVDLKCLNGNTPLLRVVRNENKVPIHKVFATCKVLLEFGADTAARDLNSATPLHVAVQSHNPSICRLLLNHGGDIRVIDARGRTPLSEALLGGEGEICLLIMERCEDISIQIQFKAQCIEVAHSKGFCEPLAVSESLFGDPRKPIQQPPNIALSTCPEWLRGAYPLEVLSRLGASPELIAKVAALSPPHIVEKIL